MRDCAFDEGKFCSALREKECIGCPFKKTRKELVEGRQRAMHRINSLPNPKKQYIIYTYHRQWRGGYQ